MNTEHIHTPDDGRGFRRVFCNGKEVPDCNYADTRKGKAVFLVRGDDGNFKLDRWRKCVIEKTVYGKIEVEFIA
ncbi:MAG TPA: hypothetical protein VIC08_10965 [Cellvibrionaceae bacterium]